jgi:hypothetical protein
MGKVHHVQQIQICYDPEDEFIGLITCGRRYTWPASRVPAIVSALRSCAGGDNLPEGAGGLVFGTNDGRVALTDEPPKTAFQNIQGQAALVVEASSYSYVMTKRSARDLADGFEETYKKLRSNG